MLEGNYTERFLNQSTPDIFGFVTGGYFDLIGAPLFYIWFIALSLVMILNKTQSSAIFGLMAFILGAMFLNSLPAEAHAIAIILMGIAIVAIIYRAVHKEGF